MAREREFATAAQRETIDGGDYRLRRKLDPPEYRLSEPRVFLQLAGLGHREARDIGAGHECAPRSRDDDRAHVVVCGEFIHHGAEFAHRVDRSVALGLSGAVDRDRRDTVRDIEEEKFICHDGKSNSARLVVNPPNRNRFPRSSQYRPFDGLQTEPRCASSTSRRLPAEFVELGAEIAG